MMLFIENGFEFQMYFLISLSIKLRPNYRKNMMLLYKMGLKLCQILWNKKLYYRQSMFFFIQNGSELLTHFRRPISIKMLRPNCWKKMVFLIQNGSESKILSQIPFNKNSDPISERNGVFLFNVDLNFGFTSSDPFE